jgi:hypothetical protein
VQASPGAANDHPDHSSIATFRRRFLKEIEALFARVLEQLPSPRAQKRAASCMNVST